MFFDIVSVLIITFFAALGMIELADWLLKNPFRKNIRQKTFIVANINSIPEDELESSLRYLFAEHRGENTDIFLDCRKIEPVALEICENLRKRFEFSLIRGEEEIFSAVKESLQEDQNII